MNFYTRTFGKLLIVLAFIFLTFGANAQTPMSGTYTIGGPTASFPDFTSAVNALNTNGVNGPVVFNVNPGDYNEQITLNNIPGNTTLNPITFNGIDKNTRRIYFKTSYGMPHVFGISNSRNITIKNLTIVASGQWDGYPVHINDQCENIHIDSNTIVSQIARFSSHVPVMIRGSFGVNLTSTTNIKISNNIIKNGFHGISLWGSSSFKPSGIEIINNEIINPYGCGISLTHTSAPVISGNTIEINKSNVFAYSLYSLPSATSSGIIVTHASGQAIISGNKISHATENGIHLSNLTSTSTSPIKVYNNSVGSGFTSPLIYSAGIFIDASSHIQLFHNSVNYDGPSGAAFFATSTVSQVNMQNNSLVYSGGSSGYVMDIASMGVFNNLDYNNYHSNGTNFIFYGGNRANLAALRNANNPLGNDLNSISGNPHYTSSVNLLPVDTLLNNKANPVTGITTDINGNTRNLITPDIGAYEFTPYSINAGISDILLPANVCAFTSSEKIEVRVKNHGYAPISNIPVSYRLNNGPVETEVIPGPIAPFAFLDYEFLQTANLSSVTSHILDVWTSLPGDQESGNDSVLGKILKQGMSGTFTIGGPNPDFNSFTDAINELIYGVCGPVVFNVAPGIYTEQIEIQEISGTSLTNTITFNGAGPVNTTLTFSSVNAYAQHTILLNGARHIKINNLTIKSEGTNGVPISIQNESENIEITNNIITIDLAKTFALGGIFTYGNNAVNNLLIENNKIIGGRIAIGLFGTATNHLSNIKILNNELAGSLYGVSLNYLDRPVVNGNYIHSYKSDMYEGGISLLNLINGFEIERNRVIGLNIEVTNAPNQTPNRSKIVNNHIGGHTGGGGSGISVANTQNVDIFHNSVFINGNGWAISAQTNVSGLDIRNNSFVTQNGHAAYFSSSAGIIALDYNNYHTSGNNFVFHGAARADLTALRAVNNPVGNDQNSVSGDPMHISYFNLTPRNTLLDNIGTPIPSVTVDINGNPRSATTPDIGAYEFSIPVSDVSVLGVIRPLARICGSTSTPVIVKIRNEGTSNLTNIPLTAVISGAVNTTLTTTLPSLNSLQDTDIVIGTINTTGTSGDVEVTVYSTLANDQNNLNDTAKKTFAINPIPALVTTDNYSCGPGTVTLTATGAPLLEREWYADSLGGTLLHQGNTFITPPLTSTTTYYVKQSPPISGALATSTTALTVNTQYGNMFNLKPTQRDLYVSGFEITPGLTTTNHMVRVFYKTGSYVGHEENPTVWTFVDTVIVPSVTNRGPVQIELSNPILIQQNQVYGIYIEHYGSTTNWGASTFSDTELEYSGGISLEFPFVIMEPTVPMGNTNTFLGKIFYSNALYECGSERFPVIASVQPKISTNGIEVNTQNSTGIINSGTTADPDIMCIGDTIIYEFAPPIGYTNADIGTKWNFTYTVTDANNATPSNMLVAQPSANNNFSIRLISMPADAGKEYKISIDLEDILYSCGDTLLERTVKGIALPNAQYTLGTACQATSVMFTNTSSNTGNITYDWDFGDGNSSTSTNATNVFANAGIHHVALTATNPEGCATTETKAVDILAAPVVDLGGNKALCSGLILTLDAGQGHAAYAWNTQASSQTINVTQAGNYKVTVTGNNGCQASDSVDVIVNISPVVDLGPDTAICAGSSVTFNAGAGFASYQWNNNSRNQTLTATNWGQYYVTVRTTEGCAGSDTVFLTVNPLPVIKHMADTNICSAQPITLDAGPGFATYLWSNNATSQTITTNAAGTYGVTVKDNKGCSATKSITLGVRQSPNPAFSFTEQGGGKVSFMAAEPSALAYVWEFGDGKSGTGKNTEHTYTQNNNYKVLLSVIANNGCMDSSTVIVPVLTVGTKHNQKIAGHFNVYPNPYSNMVNISFTSTGVGKTTIEVIDLLGKKVILAEEVFPQGENTIPFMAKDLGFKAGTYLIRLVNEEGIISKRVVQLN